VRHHGHSPFLLSPALDFAFRLPISVFASTFAGELALSDTLCLAAAAAPSPPSPGSLRPAASLAHLVSPAPAQPSTSLRHQNRNQPPSIVAGDGLCRWDSHLGGIRTLISLLSQSSRALLAEPRVLQHRLHILHRTR
jgi:hypothetical protein